MKKQNPIHETSAAVQSDSQMPPIFRGTAADLEAIDELTRQAIEFHSHPERMTPAELLDIDNL